MAREEQSEHVPFSSFSDESLVEAIDGAAELGYLGVEPILEEAKRRRATRSTPEIIQAINLGEQVIRMREIRKRRQING